MNPIFIGKVEKGKLVLNRPDRFDNYLLTLNGNEVDVIVGKIKKQRTHKENRYYWGVVVYLLSETTGYNDEEMHEALKMMFLKDTSRKIPTLRSTASLTTVEFENYMEKIRMWSAQELNCYIPLPNEVDI